jgi:protein MpaA
MTALSTASSVSSALSEPPVNLLMARFHDLAQKGGCELAGNVGNFLAGERIYPIPRLRYRSTPEMVPSPRPRILSDRKRAPLRVGIFTGLRGNLEGGLAVLSFLESLRERAWRAAGYELWLYPLCNPTGHEDARETNRRDAPLHGDFWRGSKEPEVMLLEHELRERAFHGVIVLHTEDSGRGQFTGSATGAYAERLLNSGLTASRSVLRTDAAKVPWPPGALSAPPARPQAFSLRLGTPLQVPMQSRIAALDAALGAVLASARHYANPEPTR